MTATNTANPFVAEATAAGDQWLADAISALLAARTGLWAEAVAAGMFGRLLDEPIERKKEIVEKISRGELDDRDMLAHRWAGKLSPEQLTELEDLAVAQCLPLRTAIAAVYGDEDGDDTFGTDDWRAWLQGVCMSRDELESVYAMLEAAGAGKRVWPLIEEVDQAGYTLRRCLPRDPGYQPQPTEQLGRARDLTLFGWWTTQRP